MPTVSELRAVIGLDDRDFKRGIERVEGRMEKLSGSFARVGAGLTAALTAPLVGLGARAVRGAADLQQSLNVLRVSANATGEQMARLSKLSVDLGNDIALPGVSASDAAQAMLELSKGGLSVADTMASARSVLQLAAAAQIDNARAAEITADALATFGLEGKQASLVADLLAGAANASTGSIDEMAQALAQSGASFRLMGVSVTDAVTAISLLAQAGIKGSDAGTSLKTAIMRLNPTTKEAKAAMDRLKISFFDAQGRFVGLQKAAGILNSALGKLSQQNKQTALDIIGGSDAMRALAILAEAGAVGFEKMRDKVSKAGSAAELAGAQNAGLKGALDKLGSTLDTVLTAAVQPFMGDLERLAKRTSELMGKFGDLDQATQKSLVFGAAGAALAGPALLGLAALTSALRALLPVFALVRLAAITTWAAISGPLAPLTLAILAVSLAVAVAWERDFGHIREVTAAVWDKVQSAFSQGADIITGIWRSLTSFLTGEWDSAWDTIKKTAVNAFDFIGKLNPAVMIARTAEAAAAAGKAARQVHQSFQLPDVAKAARPFIGPRLPPPVPPPTPKAGGPPLPRHDADLFAGLGKAAKKALTEAQQQLKSFQTAMREAMTESRLLTEGATDTVIRLANQFPLLSQAQRERLAGILEANEALRKERNATDAAQERMLELARRFKVMTATTLEGRLAFELFGKSVRKLNDDQKGILINAVSWTKQIEKAEERSRKLKEAEDERNRVLAAAKGLMADTARRMSLMADPSLENKIALDLFGKSFRDVTDAMHRHQIIAAATVQRWEEMKQKTEALKVPLGSIIDFFGFLTQFDPSAEMAAATKRWAEGMSIVAVESADLHRQLDLLRDSSVENQLSWKLFGVTLADLSDDLALTVFELGDLERAIEKTAEKRQMLQDLAQGVEGIFARAFMNLREGFGSFFKTIVKGFEEMLFQMAAQFLASQLVGAITSAFGAAAGGGGGGGGNAVMFGMRQHGGPVQAGMPFLVGEAGPELFVPRTAGEIVPNDRTMAGQRPIVVNVSISTPDVAGFRRSQSQVAAEMGRAVKVAMARNGQG